MKKLNKSNLIFLAVILLLIIPQTRKAIQVFAHKGLTLISSTEIISENKRQALSNYDWKLIDEDGNSFNFTETKGKVIVINFWATWCPPCIAEMPSLQKLYEKYGDNVAFLFVTNDPIDKVESFKLKNDYNFPVYLRRSNAPKELITKSIPRTLLIDKKGNIVIDKNGAVDWFVDDVKNQINKLLSE